MCANFKSRYLKITFFEKTIQARGLKLGSYVPLMSSYKLISGIFETIFFSIFMFKNGPKDVPKSVFAEILKSPGA